MRGQVVRHKRGSRHNWVAPCGFQGTVFYWHECNCIKCWLAGFKGVYKTLIEIQKSKKKIQKKIDHFRYHTARYEMMMIDIAITENTIKERKELGE